jgi:uncharacterized protein YndB with AHSA1/START domain
MKEWLGDPELELQIETDWRVGGSIVVRGLHYARFENRGVVLEADAPRRLRYTHSSSLSRLPDRPESYTTLDFRLRVAGAATELTLVMTGFPTASIFKHLELYWRGTLAVLKRHAERR